MRMLGLLAATTMGGCSELALPQRFADLTWVDVRGEGGAPPVHVVLVAIDGTRWQEVFRGTDDALADASLAHASPDELLPNLRALAAAGIALGDDDRPFEASGPNFISLPGYTEMLTGHEARCQENDCDERPLHTLLDSFRDAGALQGDVALITSWDKIERIATRDPESIVVSAGRSGGENLGAFRASPELAALLDEGAAVGPEPGRDGYRPDRYTAALATAFFEKRRPRFLFVSLGDTDEYAHNGDYGRYIGALKRADRMVGEMKAIADGWEEWGERTMILVTTDHGREAHFRAHGRAYPESARAWLVGAGGGLSSRGLRRGERRHLADIAPTIERAMHIASRTNDETGMPLMPALAEPPG